MRTRLLRLLLIATLSSSVAVPTLAVTTGIGRAEAAAACSWQAKTPSLYQGNLYGWGYVSGCGSNIHRLCVSLTHYFYAGMYVGWQTVEGIGRKCTDVGGWGSGNAPSVPTTCRPGYWWSVVQAYSGSVSGFALVGTRRSANALSVGCL
jgi:hypothetical protein